MLGNCQQTNVLTRQLGILRTNAGGRIGKSLPRSQGRKSIKGPVEEWKIGHTQETHKET
jgi:hypothetical protein